MTMVKNGTIPLRIEKREYILKHSMIQCQKNELKTFSNMCIKNHVKSSGRATILNEDGSMFSHMIVMAQGHSLQMEDLLSHPLRPIHWGLSLPEGFQVRQMKLV